MCEFEHACFISYRHHNQSRIAGRFIENLCDALRDELALFTERDLFIDTERMNGGNIFEDVLAEALCKSGCMIAVFTPTYFSQQNPYCAREFYGMEIIEQRRLSALRNAPAGTGLIIPVILRGANRLPDRISSARHYYSFESFSLTSTELARDPEFQSLVREIAESIDRCISTQASLNVDLEGLCSGFTLPTTEEMGDWFSGVISPPQSYPRVGAT